MKYYRLEYSTGPDIGSTFPQVQEMRTLVSVDSPNHLWRNSGKFSQDVYIPDPILDKKAKVTDLISSSPISFPIVSQKLKSIFEMFRKSGIQYLSVKLVLPRSS